MGEELRCVGHQTGEFRIKAFVPEIINCHGLHYNQLMISLSKLRLLLRRPDIPYVVTSLRTPQTIWTALIRLPSLVVIHLATNLTLEHLWSNTSQICQNQDGCRHYKYRSFRPLIFRSHYPISLALDCVAVHAETTVLQKHERRHRG